jgi:hypothetical protein
VNTFITFGPLNLLVRQEWIKLKNIILSGSEVAHKLLFLRGIAGRGKSSFVYYLMYCILINAKGSKKRKIENNEHALPVCLTNPCILYQRNKSDESNEVVRFTLVLDGHSVVPSRPKGTHYFIADMPEGDITRTALGECLTMAVSSDDAGKNEFVKRVLDFGGKVYVMPSPTLEEMFSIYQSLVISGGARIMSDEEIQFRFDVVGGNPRIFNASSDSSIEDDDEYCPLIDEACNDVLLNTTPTRINWVKFVVMTYIKRAKDGNGAVGTTANSLFRHYEVTEVTSTTRTYRLTFASTFMRFLAGKIRDKFTTDSQGFLTMLFGRSGVGNCHEYDAHNFFCGLTSANHPCWKLKDKKWVELPLGGGHRQKVIFRNINSISTALGISARVVLRYLLPSISNLALIDSIIPAIPPAVIPDVLQMTVSDKHRGATSRMAEIRNELGNPATVRMIFVVPESVIAKFNFPTDMPEYVEMYVTVAKAVTLAEAKKLRS